MTVRKNCFPGTFGGRDGIIARNIVDLSRCIINGQYQEVPLMGDNVVKLK